MVFLSSILKFSPGLSKRNMSERDVERGWGGEKEIMGKRQGRRYECVEEGLVIIWKLQKLRRGCQLKILM